MSTLSSYFRASALALGLMAALPAAQAAEEPAAAAPKRTSKLGECSHEAKEKGLKGDERKSSIKECMAAGKAAKAAKEKKPA